jgi:hypothetical protein
VAEGISVEVRGYPELEAGISILAGRIQEAAPKTFLGVADQAAAKTRANVHRLTGATAASVRGEHEKGGALVRMGDGVPYAQYEEYGGRGWPHSATGNFLYPAAHSVEPLLVATADKTAEQTIGAMSWPSP